MVTSTLALTGRDGSPCQVLVGLALCRRAEAMKQHRTWRMKISRQINDEIRRQFLAETNVDCEEYGVGLARTLHQISVLLDPY